MNAFLLKLLLSGVIGGVWVAATIFAGERFGARVGGLLGGLPSVVLVSYFFIGWTQGPERLFAATTPFPLTYTVGAFCVLVYLVQPWSGFWVSVLGFLALWCALQAVIVAFQFQNYVVALAIWAVFFAGVLWYLHRWGRRLLVGRATVATRSASLTARIVLSGAIIMTAVALSKLGGPLLGSVFAAFPGVFLSTLVVAHRQRGAAFARSLLAPMVVSGSISCVVYVAVLRACLPAMGMVAATAAAVVTVAISVYVSRRLIDWLSAVPALAPDEIPS